MARVLLERGARLRLPAAIALRLTRDTERLLAGDPGALKPGGRWANLIIRACEGSSGEIVAALIAAGAEVNVQDEPATAVDSTSGFTPLHAAAWMGNLGAIEVLMRHGADVTARETKWHGTPAGWADYAGRKEARDLILRGPIAIIEAIQYGMSERVKAVVGEDGAALNRPFREYGLFPMNAEGWHTPLAYAALLGRDEIVRLLVELGGDTTLRSPQDETLSEMAQKAGHREIALILGSSPGGGRSRP